MDKTKAFSGLKSEFEGGNISRRKFLRSSRALGIAATTPLILGSLSACAQAAETYDYSVVGAGAGGCAVAARLAEDGSKTVLVLEAGPADTDQNIHVPAAFPFLFGTPVDWGYSSTAQAGLNGRHLFMPRGKMFGGSTSMNAMIYIRGHASNFDDWAKDNPGWSYDEVLPYFIKGEDFEHGASDTHGAGGPLNVADQRDPNILSKAMITAAVEQGYDANEDFNSGDMTGFGLYHVTQKGGMRESAAGAYLHPVLEQENITIQGEAMAHKLLIEDGKCSGVRFESGGEMHDVMADCEVILCGGAFGSPQLLMLSGVGPAADLEALGIRVVLDVPGVGQNLQEHAMAPVSYECTQPVTLAGANTPEQAELLGKGMGLLTSNIGEAGGFLTIMDDATAPDLQFIFAPNYFIADGAGNPEGHGFSLMPGLVGTKSVGAVTLVSADVNDKVAVDPAMFAEYHDLEIMVAGVKIARKIMQSAAFDEFRGEEFMPGEHVQGDDEIREFVRDNVQTIYHPVGTCKMGSDYMAVVDERLRVRGISGLRVADASIMPTITNGNTQAPCMMIGEKCADMIKADT